MVGGIICEQKGMKLKWATYSKWTNVEQVWQMRAKGSISKDRFEDFFCEGEHFEYDKAHAQEASEQGLTILTTLQTYLLFSQKLLTNFKQTLVVEKKGKEDMVLANVQACSQMEDRRNQLVQGQAKLDALLFKLKQKQVIAIYLNDSSSECIESLSRQINFQRSIIEYLKVLVDEGNAKYERNS